MQKKQRRNLESGRNSTKCDSDACTENSNGVEVFILHLDIESSSHSLEKIQEGQGEEDSGGSEWFTIAPEGADRTCLKALFSSCLLHLIDYSISF